MLPTLGGANKETDMSSNRTGILVLGVLLLLIVLAAIVYSFVQTPESRTPAPADRAFLTQCVRIVGDERTCSCVLKEMQQQYSLDQLIRLGLQARNTGQIPDELSGALAKCHR